MSKNPLNYLHSYPLGTKHILGISYNQFLKLVQQAEFSHQQRKAEIESRKVRVNLTAGGRKPKLTIAEEVCLSLFELRQMPTFEIFGIQFDVSKTEANEPFDYSQKIFRGILAASLLEQVAEREADAGNCTGVINRI